MKIGMKCSVDSNTEIGKQPIQVTVDGTDFTLVPSEDGLLRELTVIVGIDHEKGFISNISPAREITIDYDREISDKLIDMIQYLEASLSLLFGVKKINWEEHETFFIPESEEEERKVDVWSYSLRHYYPDEQKVRLTAAAFKEVVQRKSTDESLKMVKLFHREGVREFHSLRYIQAYYNFYFILEDLYGEGKTQNRDIEQKFKSNQTLRAIIQDVLNTAIKPHGNHVQSIQNFLREENMSFDIDGIMELIVRVRGNLHHFTRKSTKRIGTPLNQRDFESMAYLLMGITIKSILQEQYGQN
jgi:hypothetical protein